jgi:hypothetical protein
VTDEDRTDLEAVIADIRPIDDGSSEPAHDALATVSTWWSTRGDGRPVVAGLIEPLTGTWADGVLAARVAVEQGSTVLVPRCADGPPSRAIIALLTRREASAVVHQPPGMTDREWVALCEQVRDLMPGLADLRAEPLTLVQRLAADGVGAVAGALLAAAAAGVPCLLDGTGALAGALVADRLCHRARGWWLPASDSADPARGAAIERLGLLPALSLGTDDDSGRASRAVLAVLPVA